MIKDRYLARMFGTKAPTAVPPICLGLFAFRDSMTIMFSFIVPPRVVNWAEKNGYNRKRSEVITQFLSPVLLQIFTAPIHIVGFDIYNHPNKTFSERIPTIKSEYFKTVAAR